MGIILSVIWFVVFGGLLWAMEVERIRIDDFYGYMLRHCVTLQETAIRKHEDREAAAANWAKFFLCKAEALSFHDKDKERADLERRLPLLLTVDVGTVAFGWLVVWLTTLFRRWFERPR